jgi:type VI secretion system secreted protein VgrG
MGPQTVAAVNKLDAKKLLDTLCNFQKAYYQRIVQNIPSQAKFLSGWINRVDSLQA